MSTSSNGTMHRLLQFVCLSACGIGLATAAGAARIPAEAKAKQRHLEEVFEEASVDGSPIRPWINSDIEIAGKLVHPRLRQSAVVLTMANERALRAGPSLVPGTAKIGTAGVSVISAHRETHFAFLRYAKVGDDLQASGADGVMRNYRITKIEVVDDERLALPATGANNMLVLYTCYPFQAHRDPDRRYVVFAEAVGG